MQVCRHNKGVTIIFDLEKYLKVMKHFGFAREVYKEAIINVPYSNGEPSDIYIINQNFKEN